MGNGRLVGGYWWMAPSRLQRRHESGHDFSHAVRLERGASAGRFARLEHPASRFLLHLGDEAPSTFPDQRDEHPHGVAGLRGSGADGGGEEVQGVGLAISNPAAGKRLSAQDMEAVRRMEVFGADVGEERSWEGHRFHRFHGFPNRPLPCRSGFGPCVARQRDEVVVPPAICGIGAIRGSCPPSQNPNTRSSSLVFRFQRSFPVFFSSTLLKVLEGLIRRL
jgi:hypothetical protein